MKSKKNTHLNLSVCHEIQVHYKRPLFDSQKNISSSEDADTIFREFIDLKRIDHKEFFWIMLLTNANQVIGISEIGVGTTQGVNVNFKEIFQLALLTNAAGIIIAHNHPSGKLEPSDVDLKLTFKLKEVVTILDFTLLDHLIITSEGYTSISDNGSM